MYINFYKSKKSRKKTSLIKLNILTLERKLVVYLMWNIDLNLLILENEIKKEIEEDADSLLIKKFWTFFTLTIYDCNGGCG